MPLCGTQTVNNISSTAGDVCRYVVHRLSIISVALQAMYAVMRYTDCRRCVPLCGTHTAGNVCRYAVHTLQAVCHSAVHTLQAMCAVMRYTHCRRCVPLCGTHTAGDVCRYAVNRLSSHSVFAVA